MKFSKLAIFTIIGLGLGVCGNADAAEFMTGKSLLHVCEDSSPNGPSAGICIGYVSGASDQLDGMKGTVLPQLNYCLDKTVTTSQLRSLVVKYLRNHPESLDQAASYLIYDALTDAYPCAAH